MSDNTQLYSEYIQGFVKILDRFQLLVYLLVVY